MMENKAEAKTHVTGRDRKMAEEKQYLAVDPQSGWITVEKENGEAPLSRLLYGGGMLGIFRQIAVVGDSLASGEMAYADAEDETKTRYADMYEHSWGQYMARACGTACFNFSKGGLQTKTFLQDVGGCYSAMCDPKNLAQAYFVALGHNDFNQKAEVGRPEDVHPDAPERNANNYIGNYARILSKILELQPKAKIFLVVMKHDRYAPYNDAIRCLSDVFPQTYLIDMNRFGQPLMDWEYTHGHGNPMGYMYYARQILTYTDWIIRHNFEDFKWVQFIPLPGASSGQPQ